MQTSSTSQKNRLWWSVRPRISTQHGICMNISRIRDNSLVCFVWFQLVKIFKKQLELEQKGLLQQFDPECAIFVCNKWDQVPDSEGEMVWTDIAKKLQANWPTRRNTDITGQMFKMSVTKVLICFTVLWITKIYSILL